jgi:hypothetical protein
LLLRKGYDTVTAALTTTEHTMTMNNLIPTIDFPLWMLIVFNLLIVDVVLLVRDTKENARERAKREEEALSNQWLHQMESTVKEPV